MPLYGTLTSMPLPDLLQWLCNARVTGTLQVEKDRVSKSIHITKGMIVGCSSDDPPQRLGHFLLSRGKITEEQLREALHLQEISGQHLGMLLVQLGVLSPDELTVYLEAQAEDTIYSLFDWEDAVFRFQENENDPGNVFPVSLRVEDVLLRGLKRYDEMREIRGVFDDPGIVLERTGKEPPAAVSENRMGKSLWELVNGERTVAEILLQVHGSEYAVTKFLFELHRSGLVKIACVKPIAAPDAAPLAASVQPETRATSPATIPAQAVTAAPAPAAAPQAMATSAAVAVEAQDISTDAAPPPVAQVVPVDETPVEEEAFEDLLAEFEPRIDLPAKEVPETGRLQADAEAVEDDASETGLVTLEDSDAHALEHNLERARKLMSEGHFEKALDILDRTYREHPGDESLRRLTAEADAAFVEKAYRHYLPPAKVLVLTRETDSMETEDLSPSEFFLLSRIDGTWDIKSIIQIAPLRESDALRTLKRMRENGLIDLRDP